jgi:hypothetical protein
MVKTEKLMSDRDFQQTLKLGYNDVDASLTTNGFLVSKVGRRVEIEFPVIHGGTVAVYTFKELQNGVYVTLYQYTMTYSDASRVQLTSAERTL